MGRQFFSLLFDLLLTVADFLRAELKASIREEKECHSFLDGIKEY